MSLGLLLTVMGNRIVEGGFDGYAAASLISVPIVVLVGSLGELVVLLFPLYARLLRNISPNNALIGADALEVVLSALAVVGVLCFSQQAHIWVLGYVLIDLFIAPVSDIADEFYGEGIASHSQDDALAFNASVDSLLAFFGFVVLAPLGATLAGVSTVTLLLVNCALSAASVGMRFQSRQDFQIPPPKDADTEEFSVLGETTPIAQFLHDLLTSGPASPLVTFFLQVSGALTGQLLFIWVARQSHWDTYQSMSAVLIVFGLAATVGPQLGRLAAKRFSTAAILRLASVASFLLTAGFALLVYRGFNAFAACLLFVFITVILKRLRLTVLNTHRQVFFSGKQFSRIMSWSYSFGALGTLAGLQLGYFVGITTAPFTALVCSAVIWLGVSFINVSQHTRLAAS